MFLSPFLCVWVYLNAGLYVNYNLAVIIYKKEKKLDASRQQIKNSIYNENELC
jgi:hypothetical protein